MVLDNFCAQQNFTLWQVHSNLRVSFTGNVHNLEYGATYKVILDHVRLLSTNQFSGGDNCK